MSEQNKTQICKFCKEKINKEATWCTECGKNLKTESIAQTNQLNTLQCDKCGGEMKIQEENERKTTASGCLLFLIAISLLFFFPTGTIIGVVLMIIGIVNGQKKRTFWICNKCGYKFECQNNKNMKI